MLATQVQYWNYKETQRHNVETEQLTRAQQEIDKRALAENIRHNRANESIGYINANANALGASASWRSSGARTADAVTNRRRQGGQTALDLARTRQVRHSIAQGWVNASTSLIGSVVGSFYNRRK